MKNNKLFDIIIHNIWYKNILIKLNYIFVTTK